ncbi:MAG: MFS transporter [Promethearchaeia archaeon]
MSSNKENPAGKTVEKEEIEYRRAYTGIFSLNYLIQGFTTSMFTVVIPIYIITVLTQAGKPISESEISFVASIILIPTAIKLLYGIISDKFGIKGFGRRRPWIIGPVLIGGIMWILIPVFITPQNILLLITIAGIIIQAGIMLGDTSMDGLIIDICPKERIGRVQGVVWGARSIGQISGGPILAVLYIFDLIAFEGTFMVLGILMILSAITVFFVKEPLKYLKVKAFKQIKEIFKEKKDIKTYFFAFFNSISEGVVMLFVALYILIQFGVLQSGTSLSLTPSSSKVALFFQAMFTLTISAGIIIGAIVGGFITDLISRRLCIYTSMIFTSFSLLLMLITQNPIILLIFAVIIGLGLGWRHSGYAAVTSRIASQHPEITSTYFAWTNSLSNLGATLGLAFAGGLFNLTKSYMMVFLVMAIAQLINLIPFSTIDPKHYQEELEDKN